MKLSALTMITGILASAALFAGGMLTGHQLTQNGKWSGSRSHEGYSATTKFRVLVTTPDSGPHGGESASSASYAAWLYTQVQTITSSSVLDRVVKAQNLASEWRIDAAAAGEKLRAATEAALMSGTDIVSVTVWDSASRKTAALADAVREAYAAQREDRDQERLIRLSENTESRIKEQTAKVEDARLNMIDVMKKNGIVDLTPLSSSGSGIAGREATAGAKAESSEAREAQVAYSAAKYQFESALLLLNTMREYKMRMDADDSGWGRKPIEVLEVAAPSAGN